MTGPRQNPKICAGKSEGSTNMQTRTLGQRGPLVSAIGLGCMSMSQHYGASDDDESIRAIHRAIDLGVTFFDTAAIYGGGHNETIVGRGLGARRKDVVLAAKCGIVVATARTALVVNARTLWYVGTSMMKT